MEKKEYLNEKKAVKTSNTISFVGFGLIAVAVIALLIGLFPIIPFNKGKLQEQLNQLRPGLEERYNELKAQGFSESHDYKDVEGFEMWQIDIALNPKYEYCNQFSGYVENDVTREYCSIKSQIRDINQPTPRLIGTLMIALPCLGFGLQALMIGKQRSIAAYNMQQMMPLAQEGMEKMAPAVGKSMEKIAPSMAKSAGAVAKEVAPVKKQIMKDMAPAYGEMAKEIAKGVKEGMKEDKKKEEKK